MNLASLVARLGETVLARRAGVTVSTLRRWIRQGPSVSGAEILELVVRRHLASVKAAETKKERQRVIDETPEPPEEKDISPEEALPENAPYELKRVYGKSDGQRRYKSENYVGSKEYITIARPVSEEIVAPIVENVLRSWRNSGRSNCFTSFLFFRYIPFNPAYTGEMVKLQGQWVLWRDNPGGWFRSVTRPTEAGIRSAVEAVFLGYFREGRHIRGALEDAETRVIWLEGIEVVSIDRIEDM